jgi:hypothetical protein
MAAVQYMGAPFRVFGKALMQLGKRSASPSGQEHVVPCPDPVQAFPTEGEALEEGREGVRCRARVEAGRRLDREAVRRGAVDEQSPERLRGELPAGLAVLRDVGVAVDQSAHRAGSGTVGDAGDHHAGVAVPDENGVGDPPGCRHGRNVLNMGIQVDRRTAEMRVLADAGERNRQGQVPGTPEPVRQAGVVPATVPAAGDQNEGRHICPFPVVKARHSNLRERRWRSVAPTLCILGLLSGEAVTHLRVAGTDSRTFRPHPAAERQRTLPSTRTSCVLPTVLSGTRSRAGTERLHRGHTLTAAGYTELPRRSEGLLSHLAISTTSGPVPEPSCGPPAPA